MVQGQSSEEKVRGMFSKCKPVGGKLGINEFEKMVGMLSETEKQTKAQVSILFVDSNRREPILFCIMIIFYKFKLY